MLHLSTKHSSNGKMVFNSYKKSFLYVTIIWIIGFLMILIASDFFKNWSLLMTMVVVISLSAIFGIYIRYFNNKAK